MALLLLSELLVLLFAVVVEESATAAAELGFACLQWLLAAEVAADPVAVAAVASSDCCFGQRLAAGQRATSDWRLPEIGYLIAAAAAAVVAVVVVAVEAAAVGRSPLPGQPQTDHTAAAAADRPLLPSKRRAVAPAAAEAVPASAAVAAGAAPPTFAAV